MKQRILLLLKRLAFLGYCHFEIEGIIKEAIGINHVNGLNDSQEATVIQYLEMYERLGLDYLQTYSK